MVLKSVFTAAMSVALLAWGSSSFAADYKPSEFLGLDLSKAVLSPKPLGPPTQFAPVAIEADTDPGPPVHQARAEPKAGPTIVVPKTRIAHLHAGKPRGMVRTKLARRHSNPLDAQAFDTRIQVWPCRSGGICNWQRPSN
jgi:hypothetical protein